MADPNAALMAVMDQMRAIQREVLDAPQDSWKAAASALTGIADGGAFTPGTIIPYRQDNEVLLSFDGPLSFLDRASFPGSVAFFHAADQTEEGRVYRAALITEEEARAIADGGADIREPFMRAPTALMLAAEDGFVTTEVSMADPETMPEAGVRFGDDAPIG